jgi:hypothetical protein
MAREVSMTGSLERGTRRAAEQFNRALQRLEELEAVPAGFFPRLTEEAAMDEVGVASLQLASYLDKGEEDAGKPAVEGPLFGSLVVSHLGSLKELEDLRRMRHSLRESCPDLLRQLGAEQVGAPAEEIAPRESDASDGRRSAGDR